MTRPVGCQEREAPGITAAMAWRELDLAGRGTTFACDLPGPAPDARTVVLLHGLMATGTANWGPHIERLNEHFRVVCIDHRGHGRGIACGPEFLLEDCADDAVALLDELGIERAVFAGYSMGGPIAQLAARRHPSRVAGLVLCATAAEFGASTIERAAVQTLERLESTVPLRPVRSLLPRRLGPVDAVAIRAAARAVRSFDSTAWVGSLDVPAAVVVTARDRIVPPARQRALADALPDAEVITIPAGHLACRSSARFGPALLEACADVAERAAPHRAHRPRWWRRLFSRQASGGTRRGVPSSKRYETPAARRSTPRRIHRPRRLRERRDHVAGG